ncbi:MAG: type II/IV secretion system protein, partial [Synergistales bacterium]|nr:type II/IV secretion system protein [Synergistales bacterium]
VSLSRLRPTSEALNLLPEAAAKRLEVIPLSVMDNRIVVATAEPLDVLALDEVRMLTGMEVEVNIATASDIRRALESLYSVQGRIEEAMAEVAQTRVREPERKEEASATDAPVIRLVDNIIRQAVREEASDIHIEPFERSTRVRFRVDGVLFDSADFSKDLHPAVVSRIKIMANMDIAEKRRPQDGRILIKTDGRRVDLRVSTLPTINGEKAAIRVLDPAAAKVGLELLGLEDDEKRLIDDIITVPYGLALVTGPTGSGKSTTLYSILESVSKPDVNVVTVEDPVEYTIPGVNQVRINEKAGVTFSDTLRAILRQDPDKIMVGEIRDTETASLAIRAALTGHL